jgi:hypothetical protein
MDDREASRQSLVDRVSLIAGGTQPSVLRAMRGPIAETTRFLFTQVAANGSAPPGEP